MLLKDRLTKVQTALNQATEEAWKQAGSSSPRSIATLPSEQDNASFLLGMDLFGQEPSVLERGIREKLSDVERDLQRVLNLSNEPQQEHHDHESPFDDPAAEDDIDPQELAQQASNYQDRINFLKQASLARSALDRSITLASSALTPDPDLQQSSEQLVQAIDHLANARTILDLPSFSTADPQDQKFTVQILDGLKHDIRRQRVDLIHKACTVLDASIQISSNSLSVKNSLQLPQAYQVLEELEGGSTALEETMKRFATKLFKETLLPPLDPHKSETLSTKLTPWNVVEQEDRPSKRIIGVSTSATSKKGTVHRLEWHRVNDDENPTEPKYLAQPVGAWKDTFNLIQSILSFVQSRILLGKERLCQLVGNKLFGKPDALPSHLHLDALGLDSTLLGNDKGLLMEELLQLLASTCLPNKLEAPDVPTVLNERSQQLLEICTSFCEVLTAGNLLPMESASKLTNFAQQFHLKYVEHRRCVILNQARDILRNRDYHNTVTVGVPPDQLPDDPTLAIFQLHRASVSETAWHLMELLRTTMDESVKMPPHPETLRPTLYRTAREMLSLFRAIIPTSHAKEVAQVPRTAAILHNDCVFFAHNCLTLGLEFREQYAEDDARGKLLRQTCLFVDMVPLFRDLADTSLGDMLDRQAAQLTDIVASRIRYFGKSLQSNESLLEWSEAETALSAGLYHLSHLRQSWKPVLSRAILRQCMGHFIDVVITMFWKQVTDNAVSISHEAKFFLNGLFRKATTDLRSLVDDDNISECSTEWSRFQALVSFLEMANLHQVEAALTSGIFRTVAAQELSKWIQACFQDSKDRRTVLQTLSAAKL